MSLTLDEFIPNDPGTGKIGTETAPWGEGFLLVRSPQPMSPTSTTAAADASMRTYKG